ncbi:siderophore-interacting protein [Martelella alba]|uniref:Siderophore-interacting protein n=1 Tax=Martelella alba TaxID=2590451 RepID=A0A506UEV6_9HYPH|nr:siderophore-interacting protein [Martelella alba]TPW32550.1 siderophore-interacting protein [Martelella alba]
MTETTTETTPVIERVRHELKRRRLTVVSREQISPTMLRLVFSSDDLADFTSAAPDDHIKIFIDTGAEKPEMRDYTPRAYDSEARRLTIDFALHEAGPVTAWAIGAKIGDMLEIGGPRGSAVLKGPKRFILIGDETALPAIGRRIEEAPAGTSITSFVAVAHENDRQTFETRAELDDYWLVRPEAASTDASVFLDALRDIALADETYVWIAAEAAVARAIRNYLVEERGHPLTWLKASGYWTKGKADATDKNM